MPITFAITEDICFKVRQFILYKPFPKQALIFRCLQYKSFENTVGKGEIARNKQFLHFPWCFSTCLDNCVPFSSKFKINCCLQSLSVWKSLTFVVWERFKMETCTIRMDCYQTILIQLCPLFSFEFFTRNHSRVCSKSFAPSEWCSCLGLVSRMKASVWIYT